MDLKGYLQTQADLSAEAVRQYDADIADKYAEGIQAGKDMIQLPDSSNPDAQYTQGQMDEAVTKGIEVALKPIQDELAAVKADLEASKAEVSEADAKQQQAIADLKATIADQIDDANLDNAELAKGLRG